MPKIMSTQAIQDSSWHTTSHLNLDLHLQGFSVEDKISLKPCSPNNKTTNVELIEIE